MIQQFSEDFYQLISAPWSSLIIIFNIILLESVLSIDNAAVLATMVKDLSKENQSKALKYGIFGAYFFRAISLFFIALLVKFWYLKVLGGIYLLYLVYEYYLKREYDDDDVEIIDKKQNWFYRNTLGLLGNFWTTVVYVEIMDLVFSIDNIFAVVAYSKNLIVIYIGVFAGILVMRFVAQHFVALMHRFKFLEDSAYLILLILGLKLCLTVFEHFYPTHTITSILCSKAFDVSLSIMTILIFFVPIGWVIYRQGDENVD